MRRPNFRERGIKLLLCVVVLCAFLIGVAQAQNTSPTVESETFAASKTTEWISGGPYGGNIKCMSMAQTNPDIIYAGTNYGLFKTIDGGNNWARTAFPDIYVRSVQVVADDHTVVYAGTDDGIYKSTNGGDTWTQKDLSETRVNAIAIDPVNSNILYAGTYHPADTMEGVFKSTDGGDNWQLKKTGARVYALLVDTNNPSYIYAGTEHSYYDFEYENLWISRDGGSTWEERMVGSDPFYCGISALAMTPTGFNPATIYAYVAWDDVYKSTDQGETWMATEIPTAASHSHPDGWYRFEVAVDPNHPNVVYADNHPENGGYEFYRSIDAGGTWELKTSGLPPTYTTSIVIDPQSTSTLYAGMGTGGVYKSTDAAENWNFSSQGMNGTYIKDLAIHPTSSDEVFAVIEGVYHLANTTNGGASWDQLANSPRYLTAVAIDPQDPSNIFVGKGSGCYKSSDGGQNWERIFEFGGPIYSMDIWINPDSSDIILLAFGYGFDPRGLYRTADAGSTWTEVLDWSSHSLAADPTDPNIIYLGSGFPAYVWSSIDCGIHWEQISPIFGYGFLSFIAVDFDSNVYIFSWKWDGHNWTELTDLPANITALASIPRVLYAGTSGYGVFVSQDGGDTWMPFNEGLENLKIKKLAISNSEPKMLYAGTWYGGVWSTELELLPCICANPDTLFFSVGEERAGSSDYTRGEQVLETKSILSHEGLMVNALEKRTHFPMGLLESTGTDWDTLSNTFEPPYVYFEDYQTRYEATKLVPERTCTLKVLRYGFCNNEDSAQSKDCEIFILDDNGGKPSTLIWSDESTITVSPHSHWWIGFDISENNLIVSTFWMGHREKTSGFPSSTADDFVTPGTNYYSSNGFTWFEKQRDYIQQAFVSYGPSVNEDLAVLSVKNIGGAPLEVQDISCDEPWDISISPKSFTVDPGGEQKVEIWLTAENLSQGHHEAILLVNSNDPYMSVYQIPLVFDVHETIWVELSDMVQGIPTEFGLYQNYPNPFNPSTTIEFSLPRACEVSITVYNVLGQKVAPLVAERLSAGKYKAQWTADNLASGVYFCRLQAGDFAETKKMLLLK